MDELTRKVVAEMDKVLRDNRTPCYSQLEPIARKLGASLCNGASRWAFVFKARRIVYKFPRWEEVDEDYCATEVKSYELGKQYGIERCLLPITFMGETASGIPLYIQPMYTTSQDALGYEKARYWEGKLHGLHNAPIVRKVQHGCYSAPQKLWLERAIQIYGKAFMRSFQKWSQEGQVNDLHSGNVGYLNKQPIIIDYAGFHD